MSDAAPLARVRLLDGRELLIGPDAARVGERVYVMSRIQEAWLLFLQPETIGLRMADVGLVEYSVARPGDGQVALEAIYRARPDLRRADAPAPALSAPPGYHAMPPVAAPQPWTAPMRADPEGGAGVFPAPPPGVYPYPTFQPRPAPRATPFPPQVTEAYGPEPERRYATLTPTPRRAGQLARATFRLVAQRFGPLLALTALVALLPNIALGGLSIAIAIISGQNPWAAEPNPLILQDTTSAQTVTPDIAQGLSVLALVAGLALAGWTAATLTVAARDVALGRPIAVFARAREGAQRLWPVISTLIITDVILLAIAIPGLGIALGMVLVVFQPPAGATPVTGESAIVVVALGIGLALATLALLAWIWPRVALATTAAALGLPAPFRTAWGLAQGGAWRILGALLLVGAVTTALVVPATFAQFYSSGLAALLFIPLAQLVSAPLNALVRTLALYDQRLRREGYALFLEEGVIPPETAAAPAPDQAAEPR